MTKFLVVLTFINNNIKFDVSFTFGMVLILNLRCFMVDVIIILFYATAFYCLCICRALFVYVIHRA